MINNHEGYYWLAYDWINFRLSCVHCNRPNKSNSTGVLFGKSNEFAIRDESYRANSPIDDVALEEPKLLDPCVKSDTQLLAHLINGEIHPAKKKDSDPWLFERARYTIDVLGFNKPGEIGEAEGPVEYKRKQLDEVMLLIELADSIPAKRPDVQQRLKERLKTETEYSCFFRSAISAYRTKSWIAAVL